MKRQIKNYLTANPRSFQDRKNDNPNYTQEQIYDTLKNEDRHQVAPVAILLEQCMARVQQLEQQDTVNKVRKRTGDPGD